MHLACISSCYAIETAQYEALMIICSYASYQNFDVECEIVRGSGIIIISIMINIVFHPVLLYNFDLILHSLDDIYRCWFYIIILYIIIYHNMINTHQDVTGKSLW